MRNENIFKQLENDAVKRVADMVEKTGGNIKQVHENRKKVYEISRKLPASVGYELLRLHDSTVDNVVTAYKKAFNKE